MDTGEQNGIGSPPFLNPDEELRALKALYEETSNRLNKLTLVLSQRDSEIERLLEEFSKREIVTPFLRTPSNVLMRKHMEKLQNKNRQAKLIIQRYLDIIEDLYEVVETLSGRKMDRSCFELLKRDKVN